MLRCDQGSEFTSKASDTVLQKYNVKLDLAEMNVHEHAGTCERLNRTIQERIRALLAESGFPSSFWGQGADAACWLYNRTPHSALDYITPYEKFHVKMPELHQISILGARCEVLDELLPRGEKTKPRSVTQFLIGYTPTGYLTYNPKTKKTTPVCNIKIYPNELYKQFYTNTSDDLELHFDKVHPEINKPCKSPPTGGGTSTRQNTDQNQPCQTSPPGGGPSTRNQIQVITVVHVELLPCQNPA